MGNPLFTLSADVIGIAQQAVTDLVNNLGKDCTLYYPPRAMPCTNCVPGPGNAPSVRWRSGGPTPFPDGSLCPLCNGKNQLFEEITEPIKMLCAWSPKDWYVPAARNVQVPEGRIQTKGFMADLPKVLRAQQMVVESALTPYLKCRFRLAGEPIDPSNIVQGQFFVALWDRAGG